MKRILVVVLMLVFSLTGLISQETKIVNGYKVTRGERPAIDLSKVTADSYEPGKLLLKLAIGLEKSIKDDVLLVKTKDGYVNTGVQAIDVMNTKFKAEIYKPALYNFYKISPASEKYRERHIAWGINRWMEITLEPGVDILAAVKAYTSLVEVEVAEPIYKKVLTSLDQPDLNLDTPKWTPNDPDYTDQWHYNNTGQLGGTPDCDIDLPEAWEIEKGNSDVIVAVIDQGVQFNHPDLEANMWPAIGPDGTNTIVDYHGTHVGGTVAAVNNNNTGVSGVAGGSGSGDGVRIMTISLFDPQAITTVLGMFTYAADNGASITQNSWGYGGPDVYVQSEIDGIDYFNANGGGSALNGGITIFAAGNDNDDGNWWPGYYSEALSVAATNFNDERSYYSNYGSWIHIAAPGGEQFVQSDPKGVYSTFTTNKYDWIQGTSMACPHVSGVAALLVSNAYRKGTILDNTDVWNLLVDNTDNIDAQNPSYSGLLGSGRLNANSSLLALQSMLPGGTPPPTPTLISPADASTTSDATPAFDWSDAPTAASYTILVDNNSNFSSPEINQSPTTSTYTPGTDLAVGIYYWKVLATNSDGSSNYSGVWDFTIESAIPMPDVPVLITPTDGSTVEDLTPTFDWNDAANATGYHIQISTNKQMSAIIIDTTTPTSDYTPPSDLAEDIYYWWVSSTNATGESNFTGYWDVNVIAPLPLPGDITLISPADASDTFDLTPAFDWSDASDATGYEILVDNNSDFSSPEINTTTTLSDYTAASDLSFDTYYWKVRATNGVGNGDYSSTWSFNVLISPPSVPTLISPVDVSTIEDPTPAFDWGDASGATGYQILVDNNSDFSSPEINTTTANSNYTPGTDLALDTYYWKVLASNTSGDSPYSGTWSFTLQAPLPGIPTLIEPADLAGVQDTTPYFDWSDASDAVSYEILVDNNSDFSSPEINTSSTPSEYTTVSALALDTYYWKVRSVNATGNSNYSGTWSFDVQAPMPGIPTLIIPTDGSTVEDLTPTFDWSDASDATGYHIQISTNKQMSAIIIDTTTPTSDYTPPSDLAEDIYYWWVSSTNATGESNFTGYWDVNVIAPLPLPGDITLISPADASDTFDLTPAFDWSDATDATGYEILVDNNSDFSSPEINTTTVNSDYTPGTDLALDTYYWKVRATNAEGNGNYSGTWSFNILVPLPGIPTLITPADVSTTQDQTPYFDWSDASDATGYEILVDNNSDFSSPEINTTSITSEYTAPSDLALDIYYWKVRSTNTTGNSNYTISWSFTIESLLPLPGIPTLIAPTDASTTQDKTPYFDWSDASDAATYDVLVDNNSDFSSPEIDTSVSVSEYTAPSDLALGTYYWKVRSVNATGNSNYSGTWSFDIQAPLPGIPTLITPTDGSTVEDLTPTFDWSDVADATGYHIQVATRSNMTDLVVDTDVVLSEFTSGTDMVADVYYWRVLATNATGSSSYTGVWDVNVIAPPPLPGIATLLSPSDMSDVYDLTPSFDWSDASDTTGYEVLVDNNSDFSSPEINTAVATSDHVAVSDLALDTYYWKVRATNAVGNGEYSSTWSFIVLPLSAPMNIVTSISGSDLVVDWDVVAGATGYDVYSSDDPYGTFTLAASVGTNQYTVAADQAKLFYYVIATSTAK